MNFHTTRRRLLGAAIAWLGLLLGGSGRNAGARALFAKSPARSTGTEPAIRYLLHGLRHHRSAAAVGRAFLDEHPAEADLQRLVRDTLDSSLELREAIEAGRLDAVRSALAARHRADFASRQVISLRGWLLSTTEVRICALASLVER